MSAAELGAAVRRRRLQMGLAQADLAGLSEQTVRKLEQGRAGPYRRQTLDALEAALDWKPGTVTAVLSDTAHPDPDTWGVRAEHPAPASASGTQVPLPWRELLAEIFSEAERHGFGRFEPGFIATPGREDEAAAFIGARADHLGPARLGGPS